MSEKKQQKKESARESIISIVAAILLALTFRSFFYEPFHIPSSSMEPTLLVGDVVFVSKYSYGYSKYSFPFSIAWFDGRIRDKEEPKRGDIIVFRLPKQPSVNYIKRLIGFPGDKIQMRNGVLYINGRQIRKVPIENFVQVDVDTGETEQISQYIETLPNGVSYRVLDHQRGSDEDNTEIFYVPEGHYFFLGDNRDNSQDSRFDLVGLVPKENFIGPTNSVFFSTEAKLLKVWEWVTKIRFERLWTSLEFNRQEYEDAARRKAD
jgi:signal peptidase I